MESQGCDAGGRRLCPLFVQCIGAFFKSIYTQMHSKSSKGRRMCAWSMGSSGQR